MDKAFSPKTLSERWGCSKQHIRNLINRGELSSFKCGNLLRIPSCEVQRIESLNFTGERGMSSGEKTALQNVHPFVPKTGERPSETSKSI